MNYPLLKMVHVACVAASYALFLLRGMWMIRGSALLQQRWVRIVPHLVDTVLLGSAVALAIAIGQYPFTDNWLSAKVAGLLLYIVLGSIALKRGRTRRIRVISWIAAQAVFFYIVAVAMTRRPPLIIG
jgi:uncharacterized membrane protein SirB2